MTNGKNDTAVLLLWHPNGFGEGPLRRTSMQRIRALSPNLALAATGLASDIEHVSNLGFELVSQHSYAFNSPVPVSRVAQSLASDLHFRSMRRGWRPLGVRACLVGVAHDGAAQIFEIDPLGNLFCCRLSCIGALSDKLALKINLALLAKETEEKGWEDVGALVRIGAQALAQASREEFEDEGRASSELMNLDAVCSRLDVAVVGREKSFQLLSPQEVRDTLALCSVWGGTKQEKNTLI
jgi:20S proteasome alpha/beta subunit